MTCTNKRRGFPWRKFHVTLRPIRMRPAAKVGDKNKNNRDCRDFQAFAKWFSMFNNLFCENRFLYIIHGNKEKDILFKIFKVTRFWQVDNFPENRGDLKILGSILGVFGLKIHVVVSALLDQRGSTRPAVSVSEMSGECSHGVPVNYFCGVLIFYSCAVYISVTS